MASDLKKRKNIGSQDGWSEEYIIRAYEMALEGKTDEEVRKAFGATPFRWDFWMESHRGLKRALDSARAKLKRRAKAPAQTDTFLHYVAGRLPPEVREVWDQVMACEQEKNGEKRLEAILMRQGVRMRQYLFLHALVVSNFNATAACRMVMVPPTALREWCEREPEFARIVHQEMQTAKKDFVEGALLNGVARGEPSLIIHASKSLNADRGYNPARYVKGGASGIQNVTLNVDVKQLDGLSVEQKAAILDAIDGPKDVTHAELPPHAAP